MTDWAPERDENPAWMEDESSSASTTTATPMGAAQQAPAYESFNGGIDRDNGTSSPVFMDRPDWAVDMDDAAPSSSASRAPAATVVTSASHESGSRWNPTWASAANDDAAKGGVGASGNGLGEPLLEPFADDADDPRYATRRPPPPDDCCSKMKRIFCSWQTALLPLLVTASAGSLFSFGLRFFLDCKHKGDLLAYAEAGSALMLLVGLLLLYTLGSSTRSGCCHLILSSLSALFCLGMGLAEWIAGACESKHGIPSWSVEVTDALLFVVWGTIAFLYRRMRYSQSEEAKRQQQDAENMASLNSQPSNQGEF
mmetsp:Transcript_17928/g.37495  ORF Transcript_17928/g.37495 Transcript_17928/m.37495 type:complete len:312 (-) Transcript_17928:270-1205(-)|eukprot:CAMPEP_0182558912 /NCGR_PEP_ID=MMETSP1324-20130603/2225_1 /TAXON_ID=236786 /ORGANISM="Florenciella sp., Strain RCC1587" /LENGTH=311 /DNA_ID=CAMNT_0024771115 /DNA_START=51 /DNA_END=986 /DNA_ORIENTATION=-